MSNLVPRAFSGMVEGREPEKALGTRLEYEVNEWMNGWMDGWMDGWIRSDVVITRLHVNREPELGQSDIPLTQYEDLGLPRGLLRWKMIISINYTFLLEKVGRMYFLNVGKG